MSETRSLTPAHDDNEARLRREAIELCGKNRGPHDYIPIEWCHDHETQREWVSRFLCRVCFNTVNTATLIANYKDLSHVKNRGIY